MKEYYIVSLKHTSKGDTALTLWRHNSNGYCWYREWAGVYKEEEKGVIENFENVFVEKEKADSLFALTYPYDDEERTILPNLPEVLQALGLDEKKMKPKK
jgi:hypothetical protein